MEHKHKRIAVFGAGAVGGYIGGKLAEATDHAVTLIGRPRLTEAVSSHGLVVREDGREAVTHPAVLDSARAAGPSDLVILAVRTYDVPAAIRDIGWLLGQSGQKGPGRARQHTGSYTTGEGLVLAVQNGVGSDEVLTEALGSDRVLAGTLTASVSMTEPGVVTRHSASGGLALSTMLGTAVPGWIVETFAAAGLPTVVIPEYRSLRWSKLLLNMLGAATCAILDVDLATVVRDPALFRLERRAFREAGDVMDAAGIPTVVLPGYPVPLARRVMRLPAPLARQLIGPRLTGARGGHSPTMRADLKRGRTEIATLNGAVARTALELGQLAPVNATLTALVEDLAQHPDRRSEFAGKPERLLAYLEERGV
jgi:2-dehydropantoate 2-reductase